MKWCSVAFAAVMFADCVLVWAAAVNFGQFVDDAASAVLVDVLGLAVAAAVLPAVTDVVELPAAVALTSLASVTVVDRVSVPSPITTDILMVNNGEGQSSHVLVFSVNLELLEIISFTLKSPLDV